MRLDLNVRTKGTGALLDVVFIPSESNAVSRLEFRAREKELLVQYSTNDKTYTYGNVSSREFQRLVNAKSVGRALNKLLNK